MFNLFKKKSLSGRLRTKMENAKKIAEESNSRLNVALISRLEDYASLGYTQIDFIVNDVTTDYLKSEGLTVTKNDRGVTRISWE